VYLIKLQFMTHINLQHVLALRCHPQEFSQIKVMQSQHANQGMNRPHWSNWNIKILSYMKLMNITLKCCDINTMWYSFQVHALSSLYSVSSTHTNICFGLRVNKGISSVWTAWRVLCRSVYYTELYSFDLKYSLRMALRCRNM